MYLFEYQNAEYCIVLDKIMAVAKDSDALVIISFIGAVKPAKFLFDTQEDADNVYIELVQAIQDFYAK